ncbi:unnamed protein product [Soboliphyme baturini]|uniref:Transthyretin-like family protein n=1 Tax=Soboliphyme baturini TaxID=241478 RepID=A0A183IDQ6_9BILA|nr:unnamed protein product [Soboliphyme baturini]
MDEAYASRNGAFQLHGCASDIFSKIDPILKIYHKCKGTPKRITIPIDQEHLDKVFTFDRPIDLKKAHEKEQDHEYHVPKCPNVKEWQTTTV